MLLVFMSNVVYYKKSQARNTPRLTLVKQNATCAGKTEESLYRINDSFASRFFFHSSDGKDWDICGRWKHVKPPSHPILRRGVEITQGDGNKPEPSSALTAPYVTALFYLLV